MADVLNFLLASLEAGLALVVLRHLARFGRAFPWLAALMAFFFLRAADRFYVALAGDEPLAFSLLVDGLAVVLLALLLFGIERMIRRADEREELVALMPPALGAGASGGASALLVAASATGALGARAGIRVRMLNQDARPFRIRPWSELDRGRPLPHHQRTVTADSHAHIRVPPNVRTVRSTDRVPTRPGQETSAMRGHPVDACRQRR